MANTVDRETSKDHVRKIRSQVGGSKRKEAQGICRKCGGRLVTGEGKYGEFTGCGNYPKCRYMMNR